MQALIKYGQVLVIILVAVGLDQWTKSIASDRLATHRPGRFAHNIELTVPDEFEGKTVREYVAHEFGEWNSEEEIDDILRGVTDEGAVLLMPNRKLEAGDEIEVRRRTVVIIPGYFDFEYTRNTGAAFSFLADADAEFRKPFFVVVSILAVVMILWILRGVPLRQQFLIVALAFICGGAIGNLIDRIQYGWVIDFIVWKYTDAYRWPTFNLADAFIVVGVAMMVIEMIRDSIAGRDEESPPSIEAEQAAD